MTKRDYPNVPMEDVLMMKHVENLVIKSEKDSAGMFNSMICSEGEKLITWVSTPHDFKTEKAAILAGKRLLRYVARYEPTPMDIFEAVMGLLQSADDDDSDCETCDKKDTCFEKELMSHARIGHGSETWRA